MPKQANRGSTGPLEASLSSVASRVSERVPRDRGSIMIRSTDTDDQYSVEGIGSRPRITRGPASTDPAVTVSGPSAVLRAVLDGELEASRAFAGGEIRVRGDLTYLEAILADLNLLDCQ
ncbi:MAG TPA: SCP2 sterol-binding domain-containing protein [Thermomicrobiales bacterium]|nr:SCP2 sterol-binding domain-containing protein [Thermomicrobiales bacterium]